MIYFCLIPPRIPEEKDLDRQTYREQTVPFYFFVERNPKIKTFFCVRPNSIRGKTLEFLNRKCSWAMVVI